VREGLIVLPPLSSSPFGLVLGDPALAKLSCLPALLRASDEGDAPRTQGRPN